MDKSYFVKIARKYLEGKATDKERQFLIKYYDLFDQELDITTLLSEAEKKNLERKLETRILEKIDLHESKKHGNRSTQKLWFSRISVAAAILAAFIISVFLFKPGTTTQENTVSQYNKMKTPRLISLPDGSTVILSTGTKLYYSSTFPESNTREVYLEGQAYFDIKHNALKPFIIHTGKIATTVLGTAFDIDAWPNAARVTVTVTRGKVKLNENTTTLGIITPNQQLIYNTTDSTVLRKTVDAQAYLSWSKEDLLLEDVTVAEAAKILETRYNVTFAIPEKTQMKKRFTTLLLKGEPLDAILLSVCEFNGVVYKYDKEKAEVLILRK